MFNKITAAQKEQEQLEEIAAEFGIEEDWQIMAEGYRGMDIEDITDDLMRALDDWDEAEDLAIGIYEYLN